MRNNFCHRVILTHAHLTSRFNRSDASISVAPSCGVYLVNGVLVTCTHVSHYHFCLFGGRGEGGRRFTIYLPDPVLHLTYITLLYNYAIFLSFKVMKLIRDLPKTRQPKCLGK